MPVPHLDATIGLAARTANITLALDAVAFLVTLHSASGDIAPLLAGNGLGSLAATAVQQALPYVLDALHDQAADPLPAVLDAVRSALGLGATAFEAAQLQQLAANPGAELLEPCRLRPGRIHAAGGRASASAAAVGREFRPVQPAGVLRCAVG